MTIKLREYQQNKRKMTWITKAAFHRYFGKNVNLKILKIYKWDISVLVKLLKMNSTRDV